MNPALHESIPSQNRREIRLLLLCAGRSLERETAEQIKSLSNEDIDWHYLVKMASLHKLQFLLYQSLKIACPESVPDGILKQLETRYLRNVAYSLRITRQLFEILDFLDDHGIQAMPFKGPVLSELAYGDLTLRPIGDLDLLVDRQNAFKSVGLFIAQGFRTELDLDHKQFRAYAAKKNSVAMYTMNDYRLIRLSKTYRRLSPSDTRTWHSRSVRKLKEFFEAGDPERSVVVTHHAPSIKSIADRYKNNPVTPAFASNMDDFILEHQPRLWIHGHTHESFDYEIGKTRVVCNPRGYASIEENKGFRPDYTVEV